MRRASSQSIARGKRLTRQMIRPAVGQCFEVDVSRGIGGWHIRIPEIDGVTHASRRAAVELKARECIAQKTGIPMGYVAVAISQIG